MKNIKRKEWLKRILHYLLAFFIPVSIFLFCMYLMDLWPFGDISFRITDAISQYPAFFEGLKDGDFFTFKIGMGANFYTIFTTYLANPINFFYLFFKNYQFDLFFLLLVQFKIGMIGLNMNILLNYKKKRSKYSWIFSSIYALSGFVSLYYFNYQFLDALYMLPLIMIGIDKIVNDNKNLMYFITLTLMIIFHYYTAYMVCIFSVIYFFFLLVNSKLAKKEKKQRIIKFFITSLFCGLCSSFITIPSIYGLMQGRSSYFSETNLWGFNKSALGFFYNLTSGSTYVVDLVNTATPVFITLFIIVLIIYTFFDKELTRKYKISLLYIIILYILSISVNFFYFGWHMFQEPVGLPGRFIFTFNCFFVLISYKTFLNLKNIKISWKKRLIICLIFVGLLIGSFLLKRYQYSYNFETRFIMMLLINLGILIFYLFFIDKKRFTLIILIFILLEIIVNQVWSFNVNFAYIDYAYLYVEENIKDIKKENKIITKLKNDTNDFFRVEKEGYLNKGLIYDYYGINYYVSLYNKNLNNFLANNNMYYKDKNAIYSSHETVYKPNFLLNSLLNIKYFIKEDNIKENNYIIKSLGFTSKRIKKNQNVHTLKNIEKTLNNLTGNKFNLELKILEPKIILKNIYINNDTYELINKNKDGLIVFDYDIHDNQIFDFKNYDTITFKNYDTNEEKKASDLVKISYNNQLVSDIFEVKKGDKIKMEIKIPKELNSILYYDGKIEYIEKDKLDKAIDYLNENIITNIKFNKFGFTGNLQVDNNKNLLLLTIPYDNSIEIKIDGKAQEYSEYLNGIIGLNVENGKHNIEFIYHIKGLNLGIIISVSSLIIFILYEIGIEKIKKSRYNKSDNKEEIY